MSTEKIHTIAGYNPSTEASFTNLLSRSELMAVLQDIIAVDDLDAYINEHYAKTVIDGSVVYYVE